jgi:hypothetical protein
VSIFFSNVIDNKLDVIYLFEIPGCEAGLPAGFTRVTEYLDFIYFITGIIIE